MCQFKNVERKICMQDHHMNNVLNISHFRLFLKQNRNSNSWTLCEYVHGMNVRDQKMRDNQTSLDSVSEIQISKNLA